MTKDVKSEVVADVEKNDVEVVDSKKGKFMTFVDNHYKGIILGIIGVTAAVCVGKGLKDVKDGKYDLLDDEEEPKIIEGVESESTEPTEEGSEESSEE